MVTKLVEAVKSRWDLYRHAAYLKKRDWTEDDYQKHHDSDRNDRADLITDYYHGYPYLYHYTTTQQYPFNNDAYGGWPDCYAAISAWCKDNCKDKWRDDILRVYDNRLCELGNDCLFYAFKCERDYLMFLLKWT